MKEIYVKDDLNPEDNAMLQALYSRSATSVQVHLEKVAKTGSGKFMESFYVGYNHKSIGDCGSTTVFIENVSMLVAKAIQDNQLYRGQESSTRYIDFGSREMVDPVGNEKSAEILKKWIDFYLKAQKPLIEYLKEKYPKQRGEKRTVYNKAIKARSFDILRGFLPAGCTTQLSWHTDLRQAWDKLTMLIHHPLTEVRSVANIILEQLKEKYPHSFCHKVYEATAEYNQKVMRCYTYQSFEEKALTEDEFVSNIDIDPLGDISRFREAMEERPQKTNLPLWMADLGLCKFAFLIDFGSFRDIQRHRNGICRMPLLNTRHKFNEWYFDQLSPALYQQARVVVALQKIAIDNLNCSDEDRQYYCAMGYNVHAYVAYGLPATVYVTELRSGKTVHPTLRKRAHQMHHTLKAHFPYMALHSDLDPSDWDIRRGEQDITEVKDG